MTGGAPWSIVDNEVRVQVASEILFLTVRFCMRVFGPAEPLPQLKSWLVYPRN